VEVWQRSIADLRQYKLQLYCANFGRFHESWESPKANLEGALLICKPSPSAEIRR
jgi:hypothetical protein